MATVEESFPSEPTIWRTVGVVGLLFTVVGLAQMWAILFPLRLGSGEWEFGTYSAFMDNLPLLLMGLGFVVAAAWGTGRLAVSRIAGLVLLLLLLLIIAGAFLYATNVPNALRTAPGTLFATGIKKAVSKAAVQTAVYPVGCLWLAISALRAPPRN